MTKNSIASKDRTTPRREKDSPLTARRTGPDTFEVPSFGAKSEIVYRVDLDAMSCECPRHRYGGLRCVKHIVLADALERLETTPRYRAARTAEYRRVMREVLTDLARRIFAPVGRGECPIEAHFLFMEVMAARTTLAMETAARIRHSMIVNGGTGRAA